MEQFNVLDPRKQELLEARIGGGGGGGGGRVSLVVFVLLPLIKP